MSTGDERTNERKMAFRTTRSSLLLLSAAGFFLAPGTILLVASEHQQPDEAEEKANMNRVPCSGEDGVCLLSIRRSVMKRAMDTDMDMDMDMQLMDTDMDMDMDVDREITTRAAEEEGHGVGFADQEDQAFTMEQAGPGAGRRLGAEKDGARKRAGRVGSTSKGQGVRKTRNSYYPARKGEPKPSVSAKKIDQEEGHVSITKSATKKDLGLEAAALSGLQKQDALSGQARALEESGIMVKVKSLSFALPRGMDMLGRGVLAPLLIFGVASFVVYTWNHELMDKGKETTCGVKSILCGILCTPVTICWQIDEAKK